MSISSGFIAQGLVRSFSDNLKQRMGSDDGKSASRHALEEAFIEQVESEDPLATLLRDAMSRSKAKDLEQMKTLLTDYSPLASSQISDSCKELSTAIKKFQETFGDILKSGGHSNSSSWASIKDVIACARNQHKEKSTKGFLGKTKKGFHRMCEGISNHSGVLKILPQEYAGPVCASIEMIVKVRKPAQNNGLRTNAVYH
jgi:hypothetical protein